MKRKNCDVCGRVNKGDGRHISGERWDSWITIMPFDIEISVCPSCRHKTFNECVYETVLKKMKAIE